MPTTLAVWSPDHAGLKRTGLNVGGGETIGACPYIWSCSQCEGVYDETLWNCRSNCSYGDHDCYYTMCEAAANYARAECYNCCTN